MMSRRADLVLSAPTAADGERRDALKNRRRGRRAALRSWPASSALREKNGVAEDRVDRRLAAIMAGDVAGYSRLMGADEEGTLRQLKAHRKELVDPKMTEHRGRIVKTTGDGMTRLGQQSNVPAAYTLLVEF